MPLYRVAPTGQLPHTIDLIQRQSAPRFANEIERDQQYPDPEIGALAVINTTVQVFNGTGWIPVGGGAPTLINHLQDVDARFPPDGAVLTWSSAAQAWGWSMPATAGSGGWCDDFERSDISDAWVTGPVLDGYETTPEIMVDGHIECAVDTLGNTSPDGHTQLSLITVASAGTGDQSIDVTFANVFQGHGTDTIGQISEGQCYLTNRANTTDASHVMTYVEFGPDSDTTGYCYMQLWQIPATGIAGEFDMIGSGTASATFDISTNPADLAVRLETTSAGHARCFFRGELVCEGDCTTSIAGDRVGFGMSWHQAYELTGTSFWVEQACVNQGLGD